MLHERRTKEKTLELCGDGQFSLWIYSSILLLLILFCACNSNQVKAIIQWVYSGGGAFALHAIQWIQYSGNTANGSVTWCTAHCIQLKTWKANNNGFGNNHHAQHSSLNAQTATAAAAKKQHQNANVESTLSGGFTTFQVYFSTSNYISIIWKKNWFHLIPLIYCKIGRKYMHKPT